MEQFDQQQGMTGWQGRTCPLSSTSFPTVASAPYSTLQCRRAEQSIPGPSMYVRKAGQYLNRTCLQTFEVKKPMAMDRWMQTVRVRVHSLFLKRFPSPPYTPVERWSESVIRCVVPTDVVSFQLGTSLHWPLATASYALSWILILRTNSVAVQP